MSNEEQKPNNSTEEVLYDLFYEKLKLTPDSFKNWRPSEYGFLLIWLKNNGTTSDNKQSF